MRGASKERTRFRRTLRANETDAERRLWACLRDRRLAGFKFVRQEQIGPYIADFTCREARLIIEADGSQHAENARDQDRDAWLRERGYRVLRFWNSDIMQQTDRVTATILAALPPSPRSRGEDAEPLVGFGVSPKGEGEGGHPEEPRPAAPPHPRSARLGPDEGAEALSPQAGRGEVRS
ncbi:endonuclease domain-containing protein [Methylobacterium goesingense]|uniref:Very-short-patch-repair endonuclease n=1 Tax=Methylobacterium goesingense TaxID=243690 RepID=A0ABV2L5U7_9HYPH|nr:DUF559 domain-containing protein [Methylobacterium goesingense]GJD75469.1 hypothetical protein CFIICLFH_3710 [Methylobacterium goesingense]